MGEQSGEWFGEMSTSSFSAAGEAVELVADDQVGVLLVGEA